MGSHHPCTLTNMELSKILLLVSSIAAAPQSSFPRIPVARFVDKVQKDNYPTDNRVKVAVSSKSPSTAAALAYVSSVVKEGLCGEAAEAYVKSILNGGSKEAAVGEATRAYITAFNSGERYEAGGACEAADRAWKVARVSGGKDHVLEATLAFIKKWPGVEDGNPCAIAGTDYVKEILAAFSDKLFAGEGVVYDPVCLDAMETFIDSHSAGEDLLTSNLKAARSFFKAFVANPQTVPADSPCASATLSFALTISKEPSSAANAAMLTYINEAIRKRDRVFDPVCGAASLAYWDAFIEKKDESAASEAAAVAYLDALETNPNFDENGACGRAAKAYMAEFE